MMARIDRAWTSIRGGVGAGSGRRVLVYLALALGLAAAHGLARGSDWRSSAELHTVLEVIATLLALIVAVMALVRYHSRKDGTILFVGMAFLGTGFLDGYHALVTSNYFQPLMPSGMPSLIPWSWVASRLFLGVFLCLSWIAWWRETRGSIRRPTSPQRVYTLAAALTAASFLIFVFVPLPRAYYPEYVFQRPEEFLPALFFLLALGGYLMKGAWRTDPIDHWLVMSLIVGFMGQAAFMSVSGGLFDMPFNAAHTLKIASYVFVLTGLLVSMYVSFRQVEDSEAELRHANAELLQQMDERQHAENEALTKARELAAKSQILEVVHNNVDIGICQYDVQFRLLSFNRRAVELQDLPPHLNRIGVGFEDIVRFKAERGDYGPGDADEQVRESLERAKALIPHRFERARGDGMIIEIEGRPVPEGGFITTYADVTERRKAEETIRRMALEDALTGLPNRTQFRNHLLDAIKRAGRSERLVGVFLLDLDNFKDVNDTLGHPAGDALLIKIAERLVDCARETDTVARLGGDEFAIVATDAKSVDDLLVLADRITARLCEPVDLSGHIVHTAASIGITVSPHDKGSADQLISNADLALYRAKGEGGNQYRLFDDAMNQEVRHRRSIESDLRNALENEELELHYQPQFDLRSGGIVGAEALIRWRQPGRGLLLPAEFIPVAESTHLIIPISDWVLREAAAQAAAWREEGLGSLSVSVNVSPLHFKQATLLDHVSQTLKDSGLAPEYLELEITESMVMEGGEDVVRRLWKLKEHGVRLAIDDFGTGYSSLSYLKKFPVDRLKIDRSFVAEVETKWDSAAICSSVIQLGHSFDLSIIAEGIEKDDQLRLLAEQGCDEGQGFLVSKAIEPAAFADFVRNHRPESILEKLSSGPGRASAKTPGRAGPGHASVGGHAAE